MLAIAGCAPALVSPSRPTPLVVRAEQAGPAPAAPVSIDGTFAIMGQPTADDCGGRIVLVARNLRINTAARTVFADVVNRTYQIVRMDQSLIAEGRFSANAGCEDSTIFERWTLSPTPDGQLNGQLESTWLLPPTCAHPCTIRFVVRASR